MKPPPTPIRAGSKARIVYDRAHAAWRAGAISSWYYGRRSPSDATVVWLIDGAEFDGKDLAVVTAALDGALARAGIRSVAFGPAWCGYRSLEVIYIDGRRLIERYDSALGRVVRDDTATPAVVRRSEAA